MLGELLVQSATAGHAEEVDRLLLAGADVSYRTSKGFTALIKACRMQRVEVVRKLIANDADVNAASNNGWTALIEACRVGHAGLAEELIDKGAEIDCTNVMGWTPMIEACRNRHLHVVKMLIRRGSNVDHRDKDNMSALDHTSRALTEIRDFLKKVWREKHPEDWKEEHRLRSSNQWPPVRDITIGDQLAAAALKGDIELADELIKGGADPNSVTSNGAYTPLIFACRSQKYDMCKFLLEHGADVNKQSTAGWTPCIEASRVGNLAIVKLLVEQHGADINLPNAFGWHGLIEACRNVNYDVVEWSLDHGAKPDLRDEVFCGFSREYAAGYTADLRCNCEKGRRVCDGPHDTPLDSRFTAGWSSKYAQASAATNR